ncbi:unnamed protein product [Eruca vesicaria subsp. sativa]|uniref:Uncharacterized protein n=1 Tax=Eruca vesicaria subsp. sativa TaxID=29727 RepID=A0ABC8KKK2_ERUVS|nr:unnamed protein product [Eruca vesicaria subsp. sativa]
MSQSFNFAIPVTVIDPADIEGLEAAVNKYQVSLFFTESPTNPFLKCVDIELAFDKQNGVYLMIRGMKTMHLRVSHVYYPGLASHPEHHVAKRQMTVIITFAKCTISLCEYRKQWVREEDLAKELKLHAKQHRKIKRHSEEQNLIMLDHRKETSKGAKM